MNSLKRNLTLVLAGLLAASALSVNTVAADLASDGEAGIDFTEGETTIDPDPDGKLPQIKDHNIYFGKHEIITATTTYNSTRTHQDDERKYAGFAVKAPNKDGWSVSVAITGFEMEGEDVMDGFKLVLTPDGAAQTTDDNDNPAPAVSSAELFGGADYETPGNSATIMKAKKGDGFGKWGCNWEGDLTVIVGSVTEEGDATATLKWTLNPSDVVGG